MATAIVPRKPFESTDSFVVKALLADRLGIPNTPDVKPLQSEAAWLVSKSGQLQNEIDQLTNLKFRRDQIEANINLLRATKQREAENFGKQFVLIDEKLKQHQEKRSNLNDTARKNKVSLITELKAIFEKLGKAAKPKEVSHSQDVQNIIKRQKEDWKKTEHELRMLEKELNKLSFELNDTDKRIVPELPLERQRALAETPKLGT